MAEDAPIAKPAEIDGTSPDIAEPDNCLAQCATRYCGPDGCGGSCGSCVPPYVCDGDGQCQCVPSCAGKQCGDNGCGGGCGTCTSPSTCNSSGQCVCLPKCSGKECGDDGCGGSCGTCTSPEICSASSQCACLPKCSGKECGNDGCGGGCGDCTLPDTCTSSGQCVCLPKCSGKKCGDNGCGGKCGTCAAGASCTDGQCLAPTCAGNCSKYVAGAPCQCDSQCPQFGDCCGDLCTACADLMAKECEVCAAGCSQKACGSDCSGKSCGTCVAGDLCSSSSKCLPPGDSCDNAFAVGALPFIGKGDTTDATSSYSYSTGKCPPDSGAGGYLDPDQVWKFKAPSTGSYDIAFVAHSFDAVLYVVTDCKNVDGSCVAGDEVDGQDALESVTVTLTAGTTYYVVVDGDGFLGSEVGTYTLSIKKSCVPACAGKQCGSDGCGGSCGTCAAGKYCDPVGQCAALKVDKACPSTSSTASYTCSELGVIWSLCGAVNPLSISAGFVAGYQGPCCKTGIHRVLEWKAGEKACDPVTNKVVAEYWSGICINGSGGPFSDCAEVGAFSPEVTLKKGESRSYCIHWPGWGCSAPVVVTAY